MPAIPIRYLYTRLKNQNKNDNTLIIPKSLNAWKDFFFHQQMRQAPCLQDNNSVFLFSCEEAIHKYKSLEPEQIPAAKEPVLLDIFTYSSEVGDDSEVLTKPEEENSNSCEITGATMQPESTSLTPIIHNPEMPEVSKVIEPSLSISPLAQSHMEMVYQILREGHTNFDSFTAAMIREFGTLWFDYVHSYYAFALFSPNLEDSIKERMNPHALLSTTSKSEPLNITRVLLDQTEGESSTLDNQIQPESLCEYDLPPIKFHDEDPPFFRQEIGLSLDLVRPERKLERESLNEPDYPQNSELHSNSPLYAQLFRQAVAESDLPNQIKSTIASLRDLLPYQRVGDFMNSSDKGRNIRKLPGIGFKTYKKLFNYFFGLRLQEKQSQKSKSALTENQMH